MGQCAEVRTYRGGSPCLSQIITTLGYQRWGKVTHAIRSKALLPPLEPVSLVVSHVGALVGQDFPDVAVDSFGNSVACGLRVGEVAAFYDTSFGHLCPSFSVCEPREGGSLGWRAFAS